MATEQPFVLGLGNWDYTNPLKPKQIIDADDKCDWTFDFTKEMNAYTDTIDTVTILKHAALLLYKTTSVDGAGKKVIAWIDFNNIDENEEPFATARIITLAGRQFDKTMYWKIKPL